MCGVLRRHDFANFTIYYKCFTVMYLIAYCLHVHLCTTCMHTGGPNVDGPVDRDHALALGLNDIGGRVPTFTLKLLQEHLDHLHKDFPPDSRFKFVGHNHANVAETLYRNSNNHVFGKVPLIEVVSNVMSKDIKTISEANGVHIPAKTTIGNAQT